MNFKKMIGRAGVFALSAFAFSQSSAEAAEEAKTAFQQAIYQTRSLFLADEVAKFFTVGNIVKLVTAVIAIIIFYIVYRVIRSIIKKGAEKRLEAHTVSIITKFVSYVFYVAIGVYILSLFGINVSAIWGAAGVAGLAVGFAAQTSVSNLISGLFVLTEKTMKIGDFIEVDGVSGTVDEIGLLSVKIHTLDNQLIRIPNSTIINTKLMNYATFDLRRFSFPLEVSYECDLEKALTALMTVPAKCPSVIKNDPDHAPVAVYTGFGDTGVEISLNVWFKRQDLITVKNEVFIAFTKLCSENPDIDYTYKRINVSILNDNPANS